MIKKFRLRSLLITLSIACVLAAIFGPPAYRTVVSKQQATAAEELCKQLGGHFSRDLVDGYYKFDLTNTDLDDEDLARLSDLCRDLPYGALDYSNQIKLRIGGTAVSDEGVRVLSTIVDKLVELDLSGLEVSDHTLEQLASGAPPLTYLGLAHTNITDQSTSAICTIETLQYLDLSNSHVEPQSIPKLLELPALWYLDVRGVITSEDQLPPDAGGAGACEIVWK